MWIQKLMMLDNFDSKAIEEALKRKGNYKIRKTDRFRELIKFNEEFGHLFDIFYEKPFLRVIFQYIVSGKFKSKIIRNRSNIPKNFFDVYGIVSDFREYCKKIEKCMPKPPLLVEVCPRCRSYNFHKKVSYGRQRYSCRDCRQEFDKPSEKSSLLELTNFDMYYFLNELVNAKILAKGFQLTCYNCGEFKYYPSESEAKEEVSCPNCNGLRELIQIFTLVELTKDIKNLDSIWLEWYVYKIISEKCEDIISILPTYKVIGKNIETEVDILILTNSKNLISIDCKAKTFKSSLSKNDIDNNILVWGKFSDLILIVTTTEISKNCKDFWGNQLKNIKFIDGSSIEKLSDMIKSLQKL